MGILGFYGRWITKYIKHAIKKEVPKNVSSVSIDMNGLIHAAKSKVIPETDEIEDRLLREKLGKRTREEIETEIMFMLDKMILEIVDSFSPRECLIMAVDGVAPVAKMQQQKVRRTRAASERIFEPTFDSNCITPGTDFMNKLDKHISNFIAVNRKSLPPTVVYSSHMVTGEGEHKIMKYFREDKVLGEGSHIVVGLDADLLVLCSMLEQDNIYICRESKSEIVSIDDIKEYLRERLGRNADEFVLLSFFLGNDFLPKMPIFSDMGQSIEFLIDTLANTDGRILADHNEIQWNVLIDFINTIANKEPEMLAELSTVDFTYPSVFFQNSVSGDTFSYTKYSSAWYDNIFKPKNKKITNKIKKLTGIDIEPSTDVYPEKKGDMCIAYIRTIYWLWSYYNYGHEYVNIDWFYPYYYTPLMKDIKNVCSQISSEDIDFYTGSNRRFLGQKDYTCLHQLLAVIPVESDKILPNIITDLLKYNSPIRDQFISNFITEKNGINYEHEGICIIPFINMPRITLGLSQEKLTAKIIKEYLPQKDIILMMTEESGRLYKDRIDKKIKIEKNSKTSGRERYAQNRSASTSNFYSGQQNRKQNNYPYIRKDNNKTYKSNRSNALETKRIYNNDNRNRKNSLKEDYDNNENNDYEYDKSNFDSNTQKEISKQNKKVYKPITKKVYTPKSMSTEDKVLNSTKEPNKQLYAPKSISTEDKDLDVPQETKKQSYRIKQSKYDKEVTQDYKKKVYKIKQSTSNEDQIIKEANTDKNVNNLNDLQETENINKDFIESKRKEIQDTMPTKLDVDLPVLVDTRTKTKTANFIPVSQRNTTKLIIPKKSITEDKEFLM